MHPNRSEDTAAHNLRQYHDKVARLEASEATLLAENGWLRERVEWLEGALIRAGGDPELPAHSDDSRTGDQ